MAHNLAKKTTKQTKNTKNVAAVTKTKVVDIQDEAAFASVVRDVRERPWHGKGTFVDKAMTSAEAIQLAGLDFKVEKFPVYTKVGKKEHHFEDKFSTVRTDTEDILGLVGGRYQPVQNTEAFDFFDTIVGKGAAIFETAGALGKGETIFITAKLPKHIKLVKDGKEDVIEQYLFLKNSHDGSSAIVCDFTPIRVVCNNTLNMALAGKTANRIYIKHTSTAVERLKEAHRVMGMIDTVSGYINDVFKKMSTTKLNDTQLKEYIAAVMSPQEKMISIGDWEKHYSKKLVNLTDEIFDYAKGNATQLLPTTAGTVFGAYNAITGYYQNMKSYDDADEKMWSMIMSDNGTARKKTNKAFDLALSLTK